MSKKFRIEVLAEADALIGKELLAKKRQIARYVLGGVVNYMPVDTGRAKANVIVSVGDQDSSWSEVFDKGGAGTIYKGMGVIASDIDPFSIVYVQNNVPYIEYLEAGSSAQAPLGIAALVVAEVEAKF